MRLSVRRVAGCALPILILTAMLFITEGAPRASLIVAAVMIHEAGHIAALLLCGHGISGISARPLGLAIVPDGVLSYGKEAVVCLAGAAANIIVAALLFPLAARDGVFFFIAVNIILAACNLLPMYSLDGGKALRCLLLSLLGAETGERISRLISLVIWCFLWFVSLYLSGCGKTDFYPCAWLIAIIFSSGEKFGE